MSYHGVPLPLPVDVLVVCRVGGEGLEVRPPSEGGVQDLFLRRAKRMVTGRSGSVACISKTQHNESSESWSARFHLTLTFFS